MDSWPAVGKPSMHGNPCIQRHGAAQRWGVTIIVSCLCAGILPRHFTQNCHSHTYLYTLLLRIWCFPLPYIGPCCTGWRLDTSGSIMSWWSITQVVTIIFQCFLYIYDACNYFLRFTCTNHMRALSKRKYPWALYLYRLLYVGYITACNITRRDRHCRRQAILVL